MIEIIWELQFYEISGSPKNTVSTTENLISVSTFFDLANKIYSAKNINNNKSIISEF